METKYCPRCETVKPVSEFNKDKKRADGLYYLCRACFNEYQRERWAKKTRLISATKTKERQELFKQGLKACGDCKAILPVTAFYPSNKSKDGLRINCRDCCIKSASEWQKNNPDRAHTKRVTWYQNNRDYAIERSAEWVAQNKERVNENARRWARENRERKNERARRNAQRQAKNHPEKRAAIKHRYRTRKLENGGSFTAQEWVDLCNRFGNICLACGEAKKLTVDHVIPISKGGSSDISNTQPLCKECNSSKGTQVIDYRLNYNQNFHLDSPD